MSLLILGATGTVGRSLTEILARGGHDVVAATRDPSKVQIEGARAVKFDAKDPSTFGPALEGVDRLFLLAPSGAVDEFALLEPFVSQALAGDKIERVVTMTAQGVDLSDEFPLRKLELFVEASGKSYVHIRPNWFSQNFHTFWGDGVREHDVIALPAADARVAFVDARDIAASAAAALTRDDIELDRAYTITGPEAIDHTEAAAILSEATGRTITYQDPGEDAFREQILSLGLGESYADMLLELFAALRMGASSPTSDDVKTLTGEPPRPLSVYARDFVDALSK